MHGLYNDAAKMVGQVEGENLPWMLQLAETEFGTVDKKSSRKKWILLGKFTFFKLPSILGLKSGFYLANLNFF